MRILQAIIEHRQEHKHLYNIGSFFVLLTLADGIASFALPVYMEQVLKNLSLVGILFSTSSIFGLLASFLFGCEQKGRTFKSYFLLAFVLSLANFFLAIRATSWLSLLLVMALWGIYYEAINFGLVEFLNRFSRKWEHAYSSGLVQMFSALGYLLGPIVASLLILRNKEAMKAAIFFMSLAGLVFFWWFGRKKINPKPPKRRYRLRNEFKVWIRVGRKSFWVLLCSLLLTLFWESLIWSMGPIFLVQVLKEKSAYVMVCFGLPKVLLQAYAGRWADKKGKKQFLILGLIIAGFFLSFFGFGNHWFLKALAAMGSAVGASLAWPAADGLLIDVVYGRKDE
ncbi:MAG TPA: MFS transporter, partial [Candidatus Bathyarchaeia archaeon]|nr:MFS transporter [Candidatus Bathyarchaeia archaeon]